MVVLGKDLKGSILDIGGGGEGFIGRAYGEQVVAIDHSQEELDEAPNGFEKVLMDATDLKYESCHFDNVTFFYTLMYMTKPEQEKAISEAARVLKSGGVLAIWDCNIRSAYPDPFMVDVDVSIDEHQYHVTYGIVKKDAQSRTQIQQLCSKAGLHPAKVTEEAGHFYLCYEKKAYMETARLAIRRFTPDDAHDLYEILGDAETMKHCEPAYDFEKIRDFLQNFCIDRNGALAAVHKQSQKVIGYILFHETEPDIYEMGWIFNRSHWRQGYAYEACKAVIDHAFRALNARRVFAQTAEGVKSVGLMQKLGMRPEGIQRSQTKDSDERWSDRYFCGLLREEWEKGR